MQASGRISSTGRVSQSVSSEEEANHGAEIAEKRGEEGSRILIESASKGKDRGKKSPRIVLSLRQLEQLFLSTQTMLQGQGQTAKASPATQKLTLHNSLKQFHQQDTSKSRQTTSSHNILRKALQ